MGDAINAPAIRKHITVKRALTTCSLSTLSHTLGTTLRHAGARFLPPSKTASRLTEHHPVGEPKPGRLTDGDAGRLISRAGRR